MVLVFFFSKQVSLFFYFLCLLFDSVFVHCAFCTVFRNFVSFTIIGHKKMFSSNVKHVHLRGVLADSAVYV